MLIRRLETFLAFLLLFTCCARDGVAQVEQKRIVCFGDSLTAGFELPEDESYPAEIRRRIRSLGLSYEVINAGVSGETSAGGLARIGWVLRQPIDIFILALGANDGLRGIDPAVTKENLRGIITKVQQRFPAAQVVIAGIDLPSNLGAEYRSRFKPIFAELAAEQNLPLVPFLLEGVAMKRELNLEDGLHPNGDGYKIVADNVWRVIQPLLQ